MEPQNLVQLDEGGAGPLMRLIDALEDQDDVQNVWANFDLGRRAARAGWRPDRLRGVAVIVLGIDPGSRYTGFGVVEQEGSRVRQLDAGRIALTGEPTPAARMARLAGGRRGGRSTAGSRRRRCSSPCFTGATAAP